MVMRYAFHLLYWIVILALSGWLISEKTNKPGLDLNLASTQTLKIAGDLLERDNWALIAEIEKVAFEYESPKNEDFKQRAKQVQKLSAQMASNIQEIGDKVYSNKIGHKELPETLQKVIIRYQDSLRLLIYDDTVLQSFLPGLMLDSYGISANWLSIYLETARKDEIHLILQNILARVKASEVAVLSNFEKLISGKNIIICNFGPIIGVSEQHSAPRVGDWYEAEIFPNMFERPRRINYGIRVDGRALEIKDGVGLYRRRYTKPGIKKYTAEIVFTNPYTKASESYKKEFRVTVVDTCR